ncbi:MAG: response regulator [Gemmatimonadetes bacterium]|nr:MAG: response regulator [Gemmatimonadota bacterium]
MSQKILVVDDDANIRKLVEKVLKFKGFEVTIATNGKEALDKVDELIPDLILVDGLMPSIDGFNFSKQVKKRYKIPIIMMTAVYKQAQYKARAQEWGIDAYLTKPFHVSELMKHITALLGDDIG